MSRTTVSNKVFMKNARSVIMKLFPKKKLAQSSRTSSFLIKDAYCLNTDQTALAVFRGLANSSIKIESIFVKNSPPPERKVYIVFF